MEKSSLVNEKRVSAIRSLLKEQNLKQKDLAERIEVEPQNLSRVMVSQKISEKMCRKIAKCFPEYRVEWLLGYDDYKTIYEEAENIQNTKDIVADSMWAIIETSLKKREKSLRFNHKRSEHVDSRERLHADCYYTVVDKEGNELKRLSAFEIVTIEQKIQEYCDFITEKYL